MLHGQSLTLGPENRLTTANPLASQASVVPIAYGVGPAAPASSDALSAGTQSPTARDHPSRSHHSHLSKPSPNLCAVPFEELVEGRCPARSKCKLEHRPVGLPRIELVEADEFELFDLDRTCSVPLVPKASRLPPPAALVEAVRLDGVYGERESPSRFFAPAVDGEDFIIVISRRIDGRWLTCFLRVRAALSIVRGRAGEDVHAGLVVAGRRV